MADRIVVVHSTDSVKTFSEPVAVTPEPMNLDWGPDARARIVVDPKGGLVVTFAIFQDRNFNGRAFYSRSNDNGVTFGKPQPITADTTSQRFETAAGRSRTPAVSSRSGSTSATLPRPAPPESPIPAPRSPMPWEDGEVGLAPTSIALDNTCECCRLGVAFAGPGKPAVVFRNIFPGSIRDHGVVTFKDEKTPGTGAPRQRRRVEDRGLPASRTEPRHPAGRLLSRRVVHRRVGAQGSVLCPCRQWRHAVRRSARAVAAEPSAGAPYLLANGMAAPRVEGIRRQQVDGALAG